MIVGCPKAHVDSFLFYFIGFRSEYAEKDDS